MVEVTVSDKRSSLLRDGINYGCKMVLWWRFWRFSKFLSDV